MKRSLVIMVSLFCLGAASPHGSESAFSTACTPLLSGSMETTAALVADIQEALSKLVLIDIGLKSPLSISPYEKFLSTDENRQNLREVYQRMLSNSDYSSWRYPLEWHIRYLADPPEMQLGCWGSVICGMGIQTRDQTLSSRVLGEKYFRVLNYVRENIEKEHRSWMMVLKGPGHGGLARSESMRAELSDSRE